MDDFYRHLSDWFNCGHHAVWTEDDPNTPDQVIIKGRADEFPSDPLSLIIGDVVQNFRGSLDHLAFALANAFTNPLPEDIARESQFPIISDVDRKGNSGQGSRMFTEQRKRIKGINPSAQAEIERLQPYQRGNRFRDSPLWMLSELSNVDKHRVVHVATVFPHIWTFDPGATQRYPIITIRNARGISFSTTGASLNGETVIGHVQVERVSNPEVNVKLEIAPSIAFADGVLAHRDIPETLTMIQAHILLDVFPKLIGFL